MLHTPSDLAVSGRFALIGREPEAERLRAAVARAGARVAVVGPGGSGKTTLVRVTLPDALVVDLTGCATAEDVLEGLARVLGVLLQGQDDLTRLAMRLAGVEVPLVLDSCEGLLDAVVALVDGLGPATRIVLTTRVRPERWSTLFLGPLGLPVDDGLASVLGSAAGQVFIRRARVDEPTWTPAAEECPALAALLHRLDGLPLAIELAAARWRMLGTRRLLQHLDDRFALLQSGSASLETVIRSSWELLDADDQALLVGLAWFRGGFDLAAVQALLGVDSPIAALGRLEALADRSLIRSWELASVPGERWYALYDSVRAFALTVATPPSQGPWLGQHALTLAGCAHDLEALEGLTVYAPDLRRAAQEALAAGDADTAHRCVLALDMLLKMRGPGTARAPLFQRARALDGALSDELFLAGVDARAFPPDLAALSAVADRVQGPRLRGWAHRSLAREHAELGQHPAALAHAHRAIEADPEEPRNLACLAEVHASAGDRSASILAYHRALTAAQAKGSERDAAAILGYLAITEHERGRSAEAAALCRRAMDALLRLNDPRRAAIYGQLLGEIALVREDFVGAEQAFRTAADQLSAVGEPRWRSHCLAGLALSRSRRGLPADEVFEDALREARSHDSPRAQGIVACWASIHAALSGRLDSAEALLGEATDPSTKVVQARWVAQLALDLGRARASVDRPAEDAVFTALDAVDGSRWSADVAIAASWVRDARGTASVDLEVASDASWFRTSEGASCDLATRHANRRVLAHLLQTHREGRTSRVDDLLAAGWPGEFVTADAGATRVYTAIATLRRSGLKAWLEKAEGGYRLKPATRISTAP